jgi:peptide/nickel transport system permease protein
MIVVAAYLQNGGMGVIILVIVLTGWAWGSRVLRSQTQTLRSRDFVTAASFSGDSSPRIIFHEIFPNMLSLIINNFFGAATAAALAEAGLEFLGLGDSTTVSWGTMIYWAQNNNVPAYRAMGTAAGAWPDDCTARGFHDLHQLWCRPFEQSASA